MQDNELVESVLAGDLDAYGQLVGRYSGAMYRFAVSITGDHHRAEEATVDAFAECFLHLASLDDPSAFGGWLKTVVKRKCWRTRSRASENDISDYSEFLADDGRDRPDLCFSRSENIRRVREALDNLPPSLGETARLFYLDDCSVREIAERLSLPEGTVKRRLYDARQKLRKELYDMDENIITTDELERKIRRYVRELGYYKRLNGGVDDTYFAKIREMEQLIDKLPDDASKNYFKADAMAFVASSVDDEEQRHKLYDEAREVGRENGNLSLLTGDMVAKFLKMISAKSQLKYLDETAIPEIEKYRDAPDYENSLGELLCWRAWAMLKNDDCDTIGDMLCDRWQVDDALGAMRAAVRANTSAEAVGAALAGIETLTRFSDYQKRGYRICPSSVSTQRVLVDNGRITTEYGNYSFAPYQLGKRGRYEDRIFGIKPLRYLQMLAGCLWNPEWKPGYTERREVPGRDGEVTIKVEEGGTVGTPCGTFHDCLKLTLEAEKEGMEPGYYFKDRYSYMWCGRKEFWFAPGVGLVRHVCTWGDVISSEAVLTAFCQPASDGREYYPMHLGSRWEYEETHLASEGYRAANIIAVQSGVGGRYEITTAQEFVYLGSVEDYEKLPRMLK